MPGVETDDEKVIYNKKRPTHLNVFTWEGLPSWIPEDSRRAIFRSIARATAANILQWTPPIINRWNPAQVKFAEQANNSSRFSSATVRYITCNPEVSRNSCTGLCKTLGRRRKYRHCGSKLLLWKMSCVFL